MPTHKKARITITLRDDLLPLLDNFIDGEKIRNRSHAIEYILGQHLGLGIQTAVIFAGADASGNIPALEKVKNRPILEYTFDMLRSHGIRNVLMVVDEHGSTLEDFAGNGSQWNLKIHYVQDDPQRKGTAAALSMVQPHISQTFLLLYSDTLADINLSDFVEHHQHFGGVGTVALTHKRKSESYGVARMEGSRIVEYAEKPGKDSKHGLVNAGLYLFEPEIFDYLDENASSLEKEALPRVAKNGELIGYPFQGAWFDISRDTHRNQAQTEWR